MSDTTDSSLEIAKGPFHPRWESLRKFECPAWFRNAKFGIWSHWGAQSVPMYGDWYARRMYIEGEPQYRHHWRVYGHPSKVGYKDIVPLWKAEKFNPEELMQLYVEAGARYFVAQAVHHDNFDNFDSKHNPWNSVKIGPMQDIVGRWRAAAMAHHLPFGLSEHLGASFNWFSVSKGSDRSGPYAGVGYDGNDPTYDSLYHANKGYELYTGDKTNWYTDNQAYPLHWFARVKDMIDQYHPDLLYTDGGVAFGEIGLRIVAHLYNSSSAEHGSNQAVYCQKDTDPEVHTVGVYDIERGQIEGVSARPWQTDTSVGDWFYNVRDTYKSPRQVLEMLVDIVSKNGNLLLNIPQRPDGTLDDECTYLLRQLAAWMKHNGEGIFDSRPWTMAAEGAQVAEAGAFKETAVAWTAEDFRFTHKDGTLYAYQMRWPQGEQSVIRALASDQTRRVVAVRLLGYGDLSFEQSAAGLQISLPQELSQRAPEVSHLEGPHCFAIRQA